MGRPTTYSASVARRICDELPFRTLKEICGDPELPSEEQESLPCERTFYRWLMSRPELQTLYWLAMEARSHVMADELIQIADASGDDFEETIDPETGQVLLKPRPEMVARARLRVDTRKFLMAKRAPRRYGDGLKVNPFRDMDDEELDALLEEAEQKRIAGRDSAGETGESQAPAPAPAPRARKKAKGNPTRKTKRAG
jgi:hypothetical protein